MEGNSHIDVVVDAFLSKETIDDAKDLLIELIEGLEGRGGDRSWGTGRMRKRGCIKIAMKNRFAIIKGVHYGLIKTIFYCRCLA